MIAAAVMGDKLLDIALANSNSSFPGEWNLHFVFGTGFVIAVVTCYLFVYLVDC